MSDKPKLESEMHPDYPRPAYVEFTNLYSPTARYVTPAYKHAERIQNFYASHPEFANEGEYKFLCPYCGGENSFEDQGGYCCGEVGHCEWVYHEVETA